MLATIRLTVMVPYPSAADIPRRVALVPKQRHQPAVAPAVAVGQGIGGQAGTTLLLDLLDHRAAPVDAALHRREQALVDLLVAPGVVAHAARGVEVDGLERPHER